MRRLLGFWQKDFLNKMIVAAFVINAAAMIGIVVIMAFTPAVSTLRSNLFPSPTFSLQDRNRVIAETALAQTSIAIANITPTVTTMPFIPQVDTPTPVQTDLPTATHVVPTLTPAPPTATQVEPTPTPVMPTSTQLPPTATPTSELTVTATAALTPEILETPAATSGAECLAGKTTQKAMVVDIVDGNTVRVLINDLVYTVRYLGTDLLFNSDYAQLSTIKNGQLVYAREITLLADSSVKDENGLLVRYVKVGQTFVNQELIRAGLVTVQAAPAKFDCLQVFQDTEQEAKEAKAGVWQLAQPAPAP